MGTRYRKSIKLGKFMRLNLSKSGVGFSIGTKGYRKAYSPNGRVRTTYSVPGTGLSYVSESSVRGAARSRKQQNKPNGHIALLLFTVILLVIFLLILIFRKPNRSTAETNAVVQPSETSVITEVPLLTTEATVTPTQDPETVSESTMETTVETTAESTPEPIKKVSPTVYVSSSGKIHSKSDCSGMKSYTSMTLDEALACGYEKCQKCY